MFHAVGLSTNQPHAVPFINPSVLARARRVSHLSIHPWHWSLWILRVAVGLKTKLS